MKWLVRMEVDTYTIRSEKIWDNYAWHKRLWQDCFPPDPDAKRDFLTRIDPLEGGFRLWILAKRKPGRPDWCLTENFGIKQLAPSFFTHQYYAFDLRANPVKTIVQRGPNGETLYRTNGKRKSGKRVPIVKHDELRSWLMRKGKIRCLDQNTGEDVPGGFSLVENRTLEISPMTAHYFRRKGKPGYHGGVQYRGTLEVTDQEYFKKTYQAGIGSAKGFGFGLLLLAPLSL